MVSRARRRGFVSGISVTPLDCGALRFVKLVDELGEGVEQRRRWRAVDRPSDATAGVGSAGGCCARCALALDLGAQEQALVSELDELAPCGVRAQDRATTRERQRAILCVMIGHYARSR